MLLNQRIKALSELGKYLLSGDAALDRAINRAYLYNNWFTQKNSYTQLLNIANYFLDEERLYFWVKNYPELEKDILLQKIIAIVCAGNLPLIGFHDILSVLICGHIAKIKLSDKDKELPFFILEKLTDIEPRFAAQIQVVQKLEKFDAIIATGNNQTAQYFNTYFGKYDHIIRNHRNSIGILSGDESAEELLALGNDVFQFFGLGCRNISLLFAPENYDFSLLRDTWDVFKDELMNHNSYRNNLDYQRTIYLMKQTPMLDIDFVNMTENSSLYSSVSCLHYAYYKTHEDIENYIRLHQSALQCVVGKNYIPYGESQKPSLLDYADNTDTLKFLMH